MRKIAVEIKYFEEL